MSEKCIHAFTDAGKSLPAYVNLTQQTTKGGASLYRLTVRTGGTGETGVIPLNRDELRDLVIAAARHLTGVDVPAGQCAVPPAGWRCTREPGHDGPCAAIPTTGNGDDHA